MATEPFDWRTFAMLVAVNVLSLIIVLLIARRLRVL